MADEDRQGAENARGAGRGSLAIIGAKVWFILTSYGIQLSLPAILPATSDFGLFRGTLSGVSILNNVLVVATIQSVSKFVSEREEASGAVLRQGLKLQALLGGALALALYLAAPWLAGFLLDDALTPLLRIACVVLFVNALYAACVGSLNGRRRFVGQAGLDASFSTLRLSGILGGAFLGASAFGALFGWAGAVIAVGSLGLFAVRREIVGGGPTSEAPPMRRWLAFMAPIWIYQLGLNAMLLVDLQVLKKTLAELALETGASAAAAAEAANTQVGYYGAAQTFAFVPYQLILSLTFIIFPMISRATSAGDEAAAQRTLRGAMRVALLALLAIAAPIAGAAAGVLRIAFREEFLAGAPALAILVLGVVAFTLFVLCATALSSAGRPALAAGIAVLGVGVVVLSTRLLVRASGGGVAALPAAATGTSIGMGLAFLLAAVAVRMRFKALLPPLSVLRAALAAGAAWAVAHFVPHGTRLMALVALAAGFAAYLLALVLLRELGPADLAAARTLLARGDAKGPGGDDAGAPRS